MTALSVAFDGRRSSSAMFGGIDVSTWVNIRSAFGPRAPLLRHGSVRWPCAGHAGSAVVVGTSDPSLMSVTTEGYAPNLR